MAVEHKDIVDAQRHEPKGISTAVASTIYVANGTGSGTWRKIDATEIEGIGSDGGVSDLSIVSDGTGGLKFLNDHAHGSMTITNNATNFPLTAVADTTFNTPSQYTLFTGVGAPWVGESLHDMTFTTDRLTVSIKGIYMINLWANIIAYPSASAKVSIRYLLNGTSYSTRKPTVKSGGVGAADQLNGFGLVSLNPGDYLQLTVASDATGNLIMSDVNTSLTLQRVLP